MQVLEVPRSAIVMIAMAKKQISQKILECFTTEQKV